MMSFIDLEAQQKVIRPQLMLRSQGIGSWALYYGS